MSGHAVRWPGPGGHIQRVSLWAAGWGRCVLTALQALFEFLLSWKLGGVFGGHGGTKAPTYEAADSTAPLASPAGDRAVSSAGVWSSACDVVSLPPSPGSSRLPRESPPSSPFPWKLPLTHGGFPSHKVVVKGRVHAAAARL